MATQVPSSKPNRLEEACTTAHKWILNPRRSGDTWIVTKNHIIKRPFTAECTTDDDVAELTLRGSNDQVSIRFNKVVDSRFRDQIGFFLVDENGVVIERRALAPFTLSKQEILEAFPPNSEFDSKELYAKILRKDGESQAHARRRWKELSQNYGFIDAGSDENGHYWRGPSEVPLEDPQLRPIDRKLREAFWETLSSASVEINNSVLPVCNSCGASVISKEESKELEDDDEIEADAMGLIDHRRPVFQGGTDDLSNLQIFCKTCNNLKNSKCRNCPYAFQCGKCEWAFPEKHRWRQLIIYLEPDLATKLRQRFGTDLENEVLIMLERIDELENGT